MAKKAEAEKVEKTAKAAKAEEVKQEEKKTKISQNALQDGFLNDLRKSGVTATIHLTNGFQIRGVVRSFDNFTVLVDSAVPNSTAKQQQLLFKHAISTITVVNGKFSLKPESKAEKPESKADKESKDSEEVKE